MQIPATDTRRYQHGYATAIELFKEHQKGTVKKSTLKSYGKFLEHFNQSFFDL
jgi:hypothetical protein